MYSNYRRRNQQDDQSLIACTPDDFDWGRAD
jgi:hypothetical protein